MSEGDNVPAWTGRPGAYEVWFLTFTDEKTGDGYWIRSTLNAPLGDAPYGTAWFARFDRSDPSGTFGIHRRSLKYSCDAGGFDVDIDGTVMRSGLAAGQMVGAGHEVHWDLAYATGKPTYRLLPGPMYRGRAAQTKPFAPNVDTAVSGTVAVDGRIFDIESAPAQQGHLMGVRHAERWAWAHCAAFLDEDAVVHALTAQARRGPFVTPYLTSVGVKWQGRWIRLTKLARKRPFGLGMWKVDVGDRRFRLSGRIEAPASDLIRARYEDPDGTPRYCHNSEVASCRLVLFERRAGGFEEVALLESRGTTHAEWAGRTPAPQVEREHVEVPA